MTMDFGISRIVASVSEAFLISGVTKSFNAWGDATETYTVHALLGVPEVMDGSEEWVQESILDTGDIVVFVDEDTKGALELKVENYLVFSGAGATVSGIFRIVNSVHNQGHFEVMAKRTQKS